MQVLRAVKPLMHDLMADQNFNIFQTKRIFV